MGIIFNGNQWEVQSIGNATADVKNGLNIGAHSSSAFTIPVDFHLQTKQFTVISTATSCSVTPASTVTLNGGTGALTVSALAGKTFFATAANTWVSF